MQPLTLLRSLAMRRFSSSAFQKKHQRKARRTREKSGQPPAVHYFHQVDDPYSHLAVQKLPELIETYRLPFIPHLVSAPAPEYKGNAEHYDRWALEDAKRIAGSYVTTFQPEISQPTTDQIKAANTTLTPALKQSAFATLAFQVGEAVWAGQTPPGGAGYDRVSEGNALRKQLGHYLGAMFYYDGEWYWGIDRLRLLEVRLKDEGHGSPGSSLCVPEPTPRDTTELNTTDITLEYFPSLRSPYTALGHRRVLALIERSGVRLHLRPVLPMLMRGVPAPRAKQRYIITDAGREARACQNPFGKIVDPFGLPVKKAFALYAGAEQLGQGLEFVSAYLQGAWFDGVDITTEKGRRQIAERAQIDWGALNDAASSTDWEALLDQNLHAMLGENLWGVPSFRVTGGSDVRAFACWGQDRIWRVEDEIANRA